MPRYDSIEGPAEMPQEPRHRSRVTLSRLPKHLQEAFARQRSAITVRTNPLAIDCIHHGDARSLLPRIAQDSIALSVWSPPYFVGKNYEKDLTFEDWQGLLSTVIAEHFPIIKPGGFLVINIADILCFKDAKMPRVSAEAVTRKRSPITQDDVLRVLAEFPNLRRHEIAAKLGCSEQTVDRRMNGNNIRGGKYEAQTRVKFVAGMVEQWAMDAGFYPYDRRVWVKDAAWENSKWASLSYRAVDEFEYLYFFWKPGVTPVDRTRLSRAEWRDWGSRGVWQFPSVRANDDHEAKFPVELPLRTIRLLTDPGDTVLDCFMGSGTTAVAAIRTGRHFIGIELESRSIELAQSRIDKVRNCADADRPC
jgi:DNA modification methylase